MRNHVDGVYTRKDRPGFWISWIDAQGRRRYRKTNASNLTQARAARAAELVRVEQAKILGFNPPGDDSFEQVADRFLSFQKVRVTEQEYDREKLIVDKHLIGFFKGKIAGIRKVDIDRFVTSRSGKVKAATVRREGMILKYILSKAVEWEIIPVTPAQRVELPKPPAGRVRYLQPTELCILLEKCPEWLRPIVGLAVTTGMRRSEILGLRWLDVDLRNAIIPMILLPQTKNGDGRIVYLNKDAVTAIASLLNGSEHKPTEKLFQGITGDQVSVAFHRACRNAKIEDFRFHDLRHTAASWFRMKGADIHTVAQLLGHKDLRMAARYQHLSGQFLSDAVRRMEGVFGDLRYQGVTEESRLIEAETISPSVSVASPTGFEPVLPH